MTTARMTALRPGASPPPVEIAMRRMPLDMEPLPGWMNGSVSKGPEAVPHYGRGTGTPSAFQMSRAYSRTVRSMENFPIPATLRMDRRAHSEGCA